MDQRDHHVCHGTNDVIKGTDETTETIMKLNAGNSKIINDCVTSQNGGYTALTTSNKPLILDAKKKKKKKKKNPKSKFFVILIIITLGYQSDP